jgi:hypothetical protein
MDSEGDKLLTVAEGFNLGWLFFWIVGEVQIRRLQLLERNRDAIHQQPLGRAADAMQCGRTEKRLAPCGEMVG